MRACLAALIALLAATPAFASDAPAPAALRIVELLPSPDGAQGQREFIELQNVGGQPVDLAGWRVQDAPTPSNATNRYTFASRLLEPGQRIVLWSNGSSDAAGPAWSASSTKWNDAGDAATLFAPDGSVHDWFAYGNANQVPPAGFGAEKPAAPPRGSSLAHDGSAWQAGPPTPGLGPGQRGGLVGANVENVAPNVAINAPATVRTRQPFTVHLDLGDSNGAEDVVAWRLQAAAAVVANGSTATPQAVVVPAPAQAGVLILRAWAQDRAGAQANHTVSVEVRSPSLAIDLPPDGSLRFPGLRPGASDVESPDRFTLRNDGTEPTTPLLDVSPFRGAGAQIPVEGNLQVGYETEAGTQWLAYTGPLQELPVLQPGQAMRIALRLGQVPQPLPAGLYGTTFTVVAA